MTSAEDIVEKITDFREDVSIACVLEAGKLFEEASKPYNMETIMWYFTVFKGFKDRVLDADISPQKENVELYNEILRMSCWTDAVEVYKASKSKSVDVAYFCVLEKSLNDSIQETSARKLIRATLEMKMEGLSLSNEPKYEKYKDLLQSTDNQFNELMIAITKKLSGLTSFRNQKDETEKEKPDLSREVTTNNELPPYVESVTNVVDV